MNWFNLSRNALSRSTGPDTFQPDPYLWRQDKARTEKYLRASGMVDANWYLNQYRDVRDAHVDPVRHYLIHGGAERRNPSPDFDTAAYVRQNPDAATAQPLLHFLRYRHERNLVAPRVRQAPWMNPAGQWAVNDARSPVLFRPAHEAVPSATRPAAHRSATGYVPERPDLSTHQTCPFDIDDLSRLQRALWEAGFEIDPAVNLVTPGMAATDRATGVGLGVTLRRAAPAKTRGLPSAAHAPDRAHGRHPLYLDPHA